MHGQIFVGDVEVTCVTDAEGPFPIKLPALFPGVRSEQWQLHGRDYPEAFADAEPPMCTSPATSCEPTNARC